MENNDLRLKELEQDITEITFFMQQKHTTSSLQSHIQELKNSLLQHENETKPRLTVFHAQTPMERRNSILLDINDHLMLLSRRRKLPADLNEILYQKITEKIRLLESSL